MTAGLSRLGLAEPTSSALRQARQRLGPAPLRALFDLLWGPAATTATIALALAPTLLAGERRGARLGEQPPRRLLGVGMRGERPAAGGLLAESLISV